MYSPCTQWVNRGLPPVRAHGETETFPWLPSTTPILIVDKESEICNLKGTIASSDPLLVSAEEGEEVAQTDDEDPLHGVVTGEHPTTMISTASRSHLDLIHNGSPTDYASFHPSTFADISKS